MAHLTAWKFDRPDGASLAMRTLRELNDEGLIAVHEAAIVEWPEGRDKPKTRQLDDMRGKDALGGAFWGLLFGILFFIPVIGVAVGAATGAVVGSLDYVGIDDDFIKRVRSAVTPGTSALFLRTSDAVQDRIRQRFIGTHMELIATDMSPEDEAKLREHIGVS
jgi:uncharacterized membrane protein